MAATCSHRRTCRLIPPNTGTGPENFSVPQLVIENGTARRYFVSRVEHTTQGDAYTLTRRCEAGDDPEEIVSYVVWFSGSGKTMCDCADAFYRPYRKCKHVAALAALRARGLI